MIRSFLGLLGILTAAIPTRIVTVFERVAVEDSGGSSINPWLVSCLRIEGLVITIAAVLGGRIYTWTLNLTGVFGAILFCVPRLYEKIAGKVVYTDPKSVEWDDRLTDRVRMIGLLYVLLALWERRRRT